MNNDIYVEQLAKNYEQAVADRDQQLKNASALRAELERHDGIWRSYTDRGCEFPESVRSARNLAYQAYGNAQSALAPLERVVSNAANSLRDARQCSSDRDWRLKGEADYQKEIDAAESALGAARKQARSFDRQHQQAAKRVEEALRVIKSAATARETLGELRAERVEQLGNAYAAGKSADVSQLEELIADAELALHVVVTEAESATAALATLEHKARGLADRLAEHVAAVNRAEGAWESAVAAMEAYLLSQQVEGLVARLTNLQAVAPSLAGKLSHGWLTDGLLVPGPRGLELPASLRDGEAMSVLAAQRLQAMRLERDTRLVK